jgi:hypothetical protein
MSGITTISLVRAKITELEGDVWLHVKAPNGNSGSLNLSKLACGPITRKAFVDWARARIYKNATNAAGGDAK